MKKFLIATAVLFAAVMSVNAKSYTKSDDFKFYDKFFENSVEKTDDNVFAYYNRNSSMENKSSFYLFALDRYYAKYRNKMNKDVQKMLTIRKVGLKDAMLQGNTEQMRLWCQVIEKTYPQAISDAANLLQDQEND